MRIKNILTLTLVFVTVLFATSCDTLFPTDDNTYQGQPKVELKPGQTSITEGNQGSVMIQLIGPQRSEDLQVNYSTGGTAQAGTHYEALSGTATISSGSSSTAITVNTLDAQDAGDSVELVIGLTGTNGDVGVAANVDSSTVFIDGQ